MMYFESREQAGKLLAEKLLDRYRYENCAVVAITDGGVLVAEQIASALHCVLNMLVTETVNVPGENASFGAVSQVGSFTYNSNISASQMQEYTNEFHGYLEDQKREAFQRINRLIGDGGTIDFALLQDRSVILVSDGLSDQTSLDVALNFLKPVRMDRLIIAAPVASVEVVDKMHMSADELQILDVKENYMDTNHYYEDNNIPSREEAVAKVNDIILNWR